MPHVRNAPTWKPVLGLLNGGLDMAAADVFGTRTAWVSDIDKGACKILAHRYPDAPNLGDITHIRWEDVEPVDVLTGGWPCQPFSTAGKRKGAADERALWPEVARAVRVLRPRFVVLENVAAVTAASTGPELARAAASLAGLGYVGAWTCLPASGVGAPHRRMRCFIVAADATHHRRERGLERSPGRRRGPAHHSGEPVDLLPTPRAARGAAATETVSLLPTPAACAANDGESVETWEARRQRVKAATGNGNGMGTPLSIAVQLLPTPNTEPMTGNGHARNLGKEIANFGRYAPAVARWEAVLGRPAPEPTETAPRGGRRLSSRFVEWMMGLPDGWVCDVPGLTRGQELKALGNGVVRQQAVAGIQANLDALDGAA